MNRSTATGVECDKDWTFSSVLCPINSTCRATTSSPLPSPTTTADYFAMAPTKTETDTKNYGTDISTLERLLDEGLL